MAILKKKTSASSEKAEKGNKETALPAMGKVSHDLIGVLVQPRISEKSSNAEKLNKYIFEVAKGANKISVKKAIEGTYKVKVLQVNMIVMKSRARNFGKTAGKTSAFKKAIVTLKKGDKIELGSAI